MTVVRAMTLRERCHALTLKMIILMVAELVKPKVESVTLHRRGFGPSIRENSRYSAIFEWSQARKQVNIRAA